MSKEVKEQQQFNWMKRWPIYAAFSGIILLIGLVSFVKWGFALGVEFTGGTTIQYRFAQSVSSESIVQELKKADVEVGSIQNAGENTYFVKMGQIDTEKGEKVKELLAEMGGDGSQLLQYEQVGPSISQELVIKTLYAILLSAGAILAWIAYQFKDIKFGFAATVATFHDAFVILGMFALFGHFFHAEIDFLFITALLTILSFSVHDTIVVYDRIREIRRKNGGNVSDVANRALSETMRRSIFNSLAIIIMLVALVVVGGISTRWFAVALLVGTISGTYSSPFVAVPLLVFFTRSRKK